MATLMRSVARRPVEQFETQVPIPDWQLTPEEEVYGDMEIDNSAMAPMVDENGMPIGMPPPQPGYPPTEPAIRPSPCSSRARRASATAAPMSSSGAW